MDCSKYDCPECGKRAELCNPAEPEVGIMSDLYICHDCCLPFFYDSEEQLQLLNKWENE